MHRIGIVDLGSNTARLVIFAFDDDGHYRLVDEIREPVRLGEGLATTGKIAKSAIGRAEAALEAFARFAAATGLESLEVVATSAVRDADNSKAVLKRLGACGLPIHIVAGDEEARLGVLAVANGFSFSNAWVMDLGGGSLQLSVMTDRRFDGGQAYPLGALRLTEAFLDSDPPKRRQVKALESHLDEVFGIKAAELRHDDRPLIAMGGTIRNLAKIAMRRHAHPIDRLHSYRLETAELDEITRELLSMKRYDRKRVDGLNPDRARVILAGALTYRWLLRQAKRKHLFISGHGIREGAFFQRAFEPPHLIENLRSHTIDSLFARFEQPAIHTEQVVFLSRRIFEETSRLHRLGAADLELLEAAAKLHDVGMSVAYYDHHKHGSYLLAITSFYGFSHREQALILLLVRYHRKAMPKVGAYERVLEADDQRRLEVLCACLRLAEHLERSRTSVIEDLEIRWDDDTLTLRLKCRSQSHIEQWQAMKQSKLVERAFERRLKLKIIDSSEG